MGNLFCSTPKLHTTKSITDTDRVVLSLKTQRKKLGDQQKLLELRIDRHVEVATELLREGKKDRALLALKKKKLTEKQLGQLGGLLLNLEDMLNNIESTQAQNKVFGVLQQGNDALKTLQQAVTLDDVQKLMDDTADNKAYLDELNRMLGQNLSEVDDEAVAEELSQLEELALAEEVGEMPKAPKVPAAAAAAAAAASKAKPAAQSEEKAEEKPAAQQLQPMLAE
mmetsp:Transcript_26231/g.57284  ORF Transcript_26231/g.57284 Transcript_26231/m.57284 type:complete len:225 (-) Transcript_26231:210-884(-)|eukprot:CAMPEP_0202919976 /NCGR_PEP_ID=MMETSP1392-20130828/76616_1 /ASSEMBLY_ACC=CAM_ASM_000868 /TAXON_ID=225041 /ORGANISM="Chlamydomonas chlamydogama, Strain SAG 11-48b" /LENGTH=224 /DNA_ID=CAMNT_0049613449 /DNA_START=125 /DNA_END=799 /DNA_ORIENTATION=-